MWIGERFLHFLKAFKPHLVDCIGTFLSFIKSLTAAFFHNLAIFDHFFTFSDIYVALLNSLFLNILFHTLPFWHFWQILSHFDHPPILKYLFYLHETISKLIFEAKYRSELWIEGWKICLFLCTRVNLVELSSMHQASTCDDWQCNVKNVMQTKYPHP